MFDHQAEQNLAAENEHVAAVKEELRPAVERARAKRAGLKAAWAKRNDFVSEVNSHQYVNGVPESAMRYIRDLNMSDPVAALDRVISEYENISCSQINDGTGLNRWPVDPNRRSAMIGAILTGLRTADLTDSILRNVAAARESLAKEVEFLTDNELMPPPPMQAPALPEAPQTVVVDTKYSPLHK